MSEAFKVRREAVATTQDVVKALQLTDKEREELQKQQQKAVEAFKGEKRWQNHQLSRQMKQ
jgi:hypothetical protein